MSPFIFEILQNESDSMVVLIQSIDSSVFFLQCCCHQNLENLKFATNHVNNYSFQAITLLKDILHNNYQEIKYFIIKMYRIMKQCQFFNTTNGWRSCMGFVLVVHTMP